MALGDRSSPAKGSWRGSSLSSRTSIVTSSVPRERSACAISQPTGPPPITTSRLGTCSTLVAPPTRRLSPTAAVKRPRTAREAFRRPAPHRSRSRRRLPHSPLHLQSWSGRFTVLGRSLPRDPGDASDRAPCVLHRRAAAVNRKHGAIDVGSLAHAKPACEIAFAQRPLPLAGVVVVEDLRSGTPAAARSAADLDPDARIGLDVSHPVGVTVKL
jgi:hypothetical protein